MQKPTKNKLRKLLRYIAIVGPGRTLFKVAGRLRIPLPKMRLRSSKPDIAVAGCGQFAFATIAYFIQRAYGSRFAACFDVDKQARDSFAKAMRVPAVCSSIEELLRHPGIRLLYIASNHASHATYAAAALRLGIDVYVEKPIAVSRQQLGDLLVAAHSSDAKIYAGYNRPFSAAIRELHRVLTVDPNAGISLECFVSGHKIPPDHWYRNPIEGTRICGNVGHWIDLLIHVLAWRGLPQHLDISLTWANDTDPDDNLIVAISSDKGDVFSLMLTSRSEPFEGISETINFQHSETICKIDDFRKMTIWQGAHRLTRRYWPKDVGHHLAILQPFRNTPQRNWDEVIASTQLMLHITQMVTSRQHSSRFEIPTMTSRESP
jgi:predicted dehydrogenase